jgi:hypothetical protein
MYGTSIRSHPIKGTSMTQTEALRLALEALETLHDENMDYLTRNKLGGENNQCMVFAREAITAIKAALEAKNEPVAFKIYKPTPPRGAIPNVRDAELPWVYDQDPSSGNVASMWVTPVQTLRSKK